MPKVLKIVIYQSGACLLCAEAHFQSFTRASAYYVLPPNINKGAFTRTKTKSLRCPTATLSSTQLMLSRGEVFLDAFGFIVSVRSGIEERALL